MTNNSKLEKFLMFKCSTCGTAKDVWYDTKSEYCHEDIYTCKKCGHYFVVSAACNKCGSSHSRVYGCNNSKCDCQDYHYDREQEEIEREF
jgi:nickel-dependent lactate racemase